MTASPPQQQTPSFEKLKSFSQKISDIKQSLGSTQGDNLSSHRRPSFKFGRNSDSHGSNSTVTLRVPNNRYSEQVNDDSVEDIVNQSITDLRQSVSHRPDDEMLEYSTSNPKVSPSPLVTSKCDTTF